MLWHGREYVCDSLLPEDKKLECGMEGKNVVVYGRLSSPTPLAGENSAWYEPKLTVRV